MTTINLNFKNSTVALAGNPYGKYIFNEQVLPKVNDMDDKIVITFPRQIEYVTSSFIQGFFDYWLGTIGYEGIKKKVDVKSDHDNVVKYIWDNVL